uniref:Uncharacterized protein n=1 Tax=Chromera velia CCMP2878 TaxID=1169474 RepID=A0A0G4HC06_9ALVE|eukprot:Cvel_25958.t1-p1 / transcript=Cvel_25958.t1 / gene=Cvel_25958 / organism=Chromera_velia_CCMP2878 / gene_product=hypothetical protein / transcript_product=hypothetical protein / location=Cvel_scaffold3010:8273-9942(-) / protein_length=171 / sequence_SO=supercontig / SO=protein_coding / is_pseudo=false
MSDEKLSKDAQKAKYLYSQEVGSGGRRFVAVFTTQHSKKEAVCALGMADPKEASSEKEKEQAKQIKCATATLIPLQVENPKTATYQEWLDSTGLMVWLRPEEDEFLAPPARPRAPNRNIIVDLTSTTAPDVSRSSSKVSTPSKGSSITSFIAGERRMLSVRRQNRLPCETL